MVEPHSSNPSCCKLKAQTLETRECRINTTMSVRQLTEVTTNLSTITLPLLLTPTLPITNNTTLVTLNISLNLPPLLLPLTILTLNTTILTQSKIRITRTLTILTRLPNPSRAQVERISPMKRLTAILPRTPTLRNLVVDPLRTLQQRTTSPTRKSLSSGFQINKGGTVLRPHRIFQQEQDLTARRRNPFLSLNFPSSSNHFFLSSAGSVALNFLDLYNVTIVFYTAYNTLQRTLPTPLKSIQLFCRSFPCLSLVPRSPLPQKLSLIPRIVSLGILSFSLS